MSSANRLLQIWLLMLGGLLSGVAQAALTINSVDLPARVGRGQTVPVVISVTRTSGSGPESVTFTSTARLQVVGVPVGCSTVGAAGTAQVVTCTAVDPGTIGSTGTFTLQVQGRALGGDNVSANQGASLASDSFVVVSGGDLTVGKLIAPSATVLNGQTVTFTLTPTIAVGGDSLPALASITVTDQLPGSAAEFNLTSVSAAGYTCNSVAAANVSRTLTCTIVGPAAALPTITLQGRPTLAGSGGLTNTASIDADGTDYVDTNAGNNTASVPFVVNPGTDIRPSGSFVATAITSTAQTLTIRFVNDGPQTTNGGQVQVAIPTDFAIGILPLGCSNQGAGTVNGIGGTVLR